MRSSIFFACLVVAIMASGPVWPNQFEQDFTEDMTYGFIKQHTKGKFFYDYTNKRYRVDRENGKGDRYCGSVYKLTDTACSHIVTEGKRYLYFPQKNDCCYCCDDSHGCGVLTPNWAADAKFVENGVDAQGRKHEKWSKPGVQDNFIYQTADTKITTQISQMPNDVQYFTPESFVNHITNPAVFNLPSQCNASKTCAWDTVCTPLRSSKIF